MSSVRDISRAGPRFPYRSFARKINVFSRDDFVLFTPDGARFSPENKKRKERKALLKKNSTPGRPWAKTAAGGRGEREKKSVPFTTRSNDPPPPPRFPLVSSPLVRLLRNATSSLTRTFRSILRVAHASVSTPYHVLRVVEIKKKNDKCQKRVSTIRSIDGRLELETREECSRAKRSSGVFRGRLCGYSGNIFGTVAFFF